MQKTLSPANTLSNIGCTSFTKPTITRILRQDAEIALLHPKKYSVGDLPFYVIALPLQPRSKKSGFLFL